MQELHEIALVNFIRSNEFKRNQIIQIIYIDIIILYYMYIYIYLSHIYIYNIYIYHIIIYLSNVCFILSWSCSRESNAALLNVERGLEHSSQHILGTKKLVARQILLNAHNLPPVQTE